MGRRGPKSSAPDGVGHVTEKGYLRILHGGRLRMAHDVVWETAHGPIPEGMQIHHVDENKLNNTIENLVLLTPTEHKRIHSGCKRLDDGTWLKPCGVCKVKKPVSIEHWYISKEGWPLYGRCRPCHIARVVDDKRKRTEHA